MREKVMFLRVEPVWAKEEEEILEKIGFIKTEDIQPSQTLILNLDKSKDELLQEMHPKTRYNIRLAKRRGVAIKITDDWDYFEIFYQLLNQTAHRQRIKLHPKGYYQKMLEVLSKENMARLFLAGFHGKIIAANLVLFFGKYAFYLHGGADHHYRDVMAPYLLQWCAIQEAKKRSCHFYDFWGVTKEKDHPFAGITRFKQGFAPKTPFTEYAGAWDLVYQPGWHRIYRIVSNLKSKM